MARRVLAPMPSRARWRSVSISPSLRSPASRSRPPSGSTADSGSSSKAGRDWGSGDGDRPVAAARPPGEGRAVTARAARRAAPFPPARLRRAACRAWRAARLRATRAPDRRRHRRSARICARGSPLARSSPPSRTAIGRAASLVSASSTSEAASRPRRSATSNRLRARAGRARERPAHR